MPHSSSSRYPSMEQSAGLASKSVPSRSSTAIPSDACSKRYWKSSLACAGNACEDMTTPESVLTLPSSGLKVEFLVKSDVGDKEQLEAGENYKWSLIKPTQ